MGVWGALLVVCVSRCRGCCSLSVCVCGLLICLYQKNFGVTFGDFTKRDSLWGTHVALTTKHENEVDALSVITISRGCFERCALCSRRHFMASMFSCLSACFFLLCLLYVAVCSTSFVCDVRSISKTLARERERAAEMSRLKGGSSLRDDP